MKIEQQVTSLEISKRLKELGVKQESYFEWRDLRERSSDEPWITMAHYFPHSTEIIASAFTVSELGEMLPARVKEKGDTGHYMLICEKHADFSVKYVTYEQGVGFILGGHKSVFHADTEADSRGKMLIYLLENNLISNVN